MRTFILPAVAAALMASTAVIAQEDASKTDTLEKMPSATEQLDAAPADKMTEPPAETAAAPARVNAENVLLSDEEARKWIDKVVYSSDAKNVGEVAAFARDGSGHVTELHADIGGFLGVGETRVRVLPKDFTLAGDHVVLSLTAEQAKALPKVPKS